VKYRHKDGKIIIQPKEDLFKEGIQSPNCVDAAVLTMVVSDTMIKSNKVYKQFGTTFRDQTEEWWGKEGLPGKTVGKWP
jgi:hypothetical protein